MTEPLISVVMPSYNQGEFIEEAIASFASQDYREKELVVIDGGSTDGAWDTIVRHSGNIAYCRSEPDRGQSHAINKGLAVAKGAILTWLNSDDILLPGTLNRIAEAFARCPSQQRFWAAAGCLWISREGTIIRCTRARTAGGGGARRGPISVYGPSSFFSRRLLDAVGPLREDFHFMMDTELWLRFARAGFRMAAISHYAWALRLHEKAKMSGHNFPSSEMSALTHPSWDARRRERALIQEEYGSTDGGVFQSVFQRGLDAICSSAWYWGRLDTIRWRGCEWRSAFGPGIRHDSIG